jgi:hypothetical protein
VSVWIRCSAALLPKSLVPDITWTGVLMKRMGGGFETFAFAGFGCCCFHFSPGVCVIEQAVPLL